ncbi:MAG: hypothetical protein VXW22_14455 [Pseudomonadota bacterium]|nr:hypothetical protein [Pseudomonadota bacterium]
MKTLIMSALVLTIVGTAQADFLSFDCKAPKGKNYYAEGGIISAADAGWQDDGISRGHFLIRLNTETAGISYQYKDANGTWWNPVEDEGAIQEVVAVNGDYNGSLQFAVISAGPDFSTVTSIVLTGMFTGDAQMLITTARHGMMNNTSVMVADCEASGTELAQ